MGVPDERLSCIFVTFIEVFFFSSVHPGDTMIANGTFQNWTPLRMLPESGSIPQKVD
jgi:hypothetical protein